MKEILGPETAATPEGHGVDAGHLEPGLTVPARFGEEEQPGAGAAHPPTRGKPTIWVEEIRLSHFRAMEDARVVLSDLTLLVGRNGAGKTTIAEALDFLRDALTEGLEIALERRGGLGGIRHRRSEDQPGADLPGVSVAVALRVSPWPEPKRAKQDEALRPEGKVPLDERVVYGIRLQLDPVTAEILIDEVLRTTPGDVSFERRGNEVTSTLSGAPRSAGAGALLLPLIAGLHPGWAVVLDALRGLRVYVLSPAAIRNEPPIGSAANLLRDGGNAGDILKALESSRAEVSWIVARLGAITPGIVGVRSGSQVGRRILEFLQRVEDDEQGRPVAFRGVEMSDGTLRALGVLLAFRQRPAPSLVFIDEIEDSVHPAALSVLLDAAEATAAERCQVVLTSHSPEVLSHPAVNGDNVRLVTWRGGRSHVHLLSEGTRESLVPPDTVGDLLRVNALQPDEAPLRVEGDIFGFEPGGLRSFVRSEPGGRPSPSFRSI